MRIKKQVFAVLTAAFMIINSGARVYAADASAEAYIAEFERLTGCGSVSVAVYDQGELRFYGDEQGLYQIGSMTKAFTGLAVLKLISEGVLSGTDRISELIPGFEAYYGGERAEITIDQLLSQTSGYTNSETDYPSAAEGMSLNEWARAISGRELQSEPGFKYAYSNVNYNLLGTVIENVSGVTYREYMEEEILGPLGLNDTFAGVPMDSGRIISGTRLGYGNTFAYDVPVREASVPAGYFYSGIRDMGRWIQIWTGHADIPDLYRGLVQSVRDRLTAPGDYYSGFECFEGGVTGHSGGTPNYSSRMVFSDEAGVCVLTGLNVAASTDSLCNDIYDMITGKVHGRILTDVWTVFDRIFSIVTFAGVVFLFIIIRMRKRTALIISCAVSAVTAIVLMTVMPLIFGAGLSQILFIWAPYSVAGGSFIIIADALVSAVMLRKTAYIRPGRDGP